MKPSIARRNFAPEFWVMTQAQPVAADDRCVLTEKRRHDGQVRFLLQRFEGVLHVEREEEPRRGLQTQLLVQFEDVGRFRQWLDNDRIRFEHPALCDGLKRAADRLWRSADVGAPGV